MRVKIQERLNDGINQRLEQIKIHKKEISRLEKLNEQLKPHQIKTLIEDEEVAIRHYEIGIEKRKKALKDEYFIYSLAFNHLENPDHAWILEDAYFRIQAFREAKIDPKSYPGIKDQTPDMVHTPAKIKHDLTELFRSLYYKESNIRNILKELFEDEVRLPRSAKKLQTKTKDGFNIIHFVIASDNL